MGERVTTGVGAWRKERILFGFLGEEKFKYLFLQQRP
jgi:hypothetical protein